MAIAENVRKSITHHQTSQRSSTANVSAEAHVQSIASGRAEFDGQSLRCGIVIGINNGRRGCACLCGISLRSGGNGHLVREGEERRRMIDTVGINESKVGVAAWHTVH